MGETSVHWYDSTRIVITLFSIVGVLVGLIYLNMFNTISNHATRIELIERRNERMDEKIETIYRDVKEIKEEIKRR